MNFNATRQPQTGRELLDKAQAEAVLKELYEVMGWHWKGLTDKRITNVFPRPNETRLISMRALTKIGNELKAQARHKIPQTVKTNSLPSFAALKLSISRLADDEAKRDKNIQTVKRWYGIGE